MKKIQKMLCAAVAAITAGFGLTGCQQDHNFAPEQPSNSDQVTVNAQLLVEQEDGTYLEVDPSFLRAVDDTYGSWTGLGTYPANTQVTVTFTSKSPWWIYSFFDKSKGEGSGLTGNRTTTTKSVTFTVTKDVTYVAKVRKLGNKTTEASANKGQVNIDSKGGSDNVTIKITETTPIIGKDGSQVDKIVKSNVVPGTVTVKDKPSWVTTDTGKGTVTIKAGANLQPDRTTDTSRDGTVTIIADGKEVVVKVHQDSRFEVPNNEVRSDEWAFKDGSGKPNAQYRYNFKPEGNSYDIKGLYANFGKNPVDVITAVYLNGKLTAKSEWITRSATWTYGKPSLNWVTNTDRVYKAGKNETGKDRATSVAVVKLTLAGRTEMLCQSKINFTQTTAGFIVDGEIQ